MKPNFLIIGAAKCGSTTINSLLGLHPDVYTVPDEVAFFAFDEIIKEEFLGMKACFLMGRELSVLVKTVIITPYIPHVTK